MDPDIELQIKVDVLGLDNMKRLQSVLGALPGQLGKITESTNEQQNVWEQLRNRLDQIETKYDAVFRAGFRLQALGQDLNRVGQSGIDVLQGSVDQWGDFEFALNRAAGSLSIFGNTLPIYEKLRQGIYSVAQQARIFPAEDIAKAVYYWGSTTGQTVESQKDLDVVMRGLIPIMQTAAITETDYEDAIKGVYAILQQYGLRLEDAGEITKKLGLTAQKTAAEFPDLIQSFKMMGPLAHSLGINFDEVVKYVGLAADAGIRGTQSGRALRQTFIKLVDPTARATKALNEVAQRAFGAGTSFKDIIFPNGEFIGFTKYVDILAQSMESMSQAQKNELLGIITTQAELPVLTALINKQIEARKGHQNAIDGEKYALDSYEERFEQTFALLKNSWQGIVGLWNNSVIPIMHEIGKNVAVMLEPTVTWFSKLAQAAAQFLEQHEALTQWIVKVIAFGSAFLVVAGSVFIVLGSVIALAAGIGFLVEGIGAFWEIIVKGTAEAADEATGAAQKIGKAAAESFGKLGSFAAKVLGFFTRGGALVVALAAIFVTNFGGMRDAVLHLMRALSDFGDFLDRILTVAQRTFETAMRTVGGAILRVAEIITKVLAGAIDWLASAFENSGDSSRGLADATELLASALGVLLGVSLAFKTAVTVWAAFKAAVLGVKGAYLGLIALRGKLIAFAAAMYAWSGLQLVLQLVTVGVLALRAALIALGLTPVMIAITAIIVGIGLLIGVVMLAGSVISNFAMDFGDMGDTIHDIADDTGKSYDEVKDKIKKDMAETGDSFEQAAVRVRGAMSGMVEDTGESVRQETMHMQQLHQGTKQAIDDTEAVLETLPDEVQKVIDDTGATLAKAGDGWSAKLKDGTTVFTSSVTAMADALPLAIEAADRRAQEKARLIPGDIAASIIEGRDKVVQAAEGLAKAATDPLLEKAKIDELRKQAKEAAGTYQKALKDHTPGTAAAAKAQYIQSEIELAGHLLRQDPKSKEAAGILAKYLKSSDPATKAAAQQMYDAVTERAKVMQGDVEQIALDTGQSMPDALAQYVEETASKADDVRQAAANHLRLNALDIGQDAGQTYSDGVNSKKGDAKKAGQGLRGAALEGSDGSLHQSGVNVGASWVDGVLDALRDNRWRIAEAAGIATSGLRGKSPPKEGPLRFIDDWGFNVGSAWVGGFEKGAIQTMGSTVKTIATQMSSLASRASASLSQASSLAMNDSATGSFGFNTTSNKQVVIKVDVTSSDGTVSDKNAQSIADAIHKGLMLDRVEHMAGL